MSLKTRVIDAIIAREKGYVNDPDDSGGETKYGITVAVARRAGYTGPMRDMPRSVAEAIYADWYWDSLSLGDVEAIDADVAGELADTGVNMGTGRPGKFLQRALNAFNQRGVLWPDLAVDGVIGPRTIEALRAYFDHRGADAAPVLLAALNAQQGEAYLSLVESRQKDEKYVFGWFLHRVAVPA